MAARCAALCFELWEFSSFLSAWATKNNRSLSTAQKCKIYVRQSGRCVRTTGRWVWPMLDRTCLATTLAWQVTLHALMTFAFFFRIMIAVIIALGLALLQKEAGIVVFLSCCLVMVHCCVLMSQMSEAASLIPNCSACKHDSSCPHTIIQADSSALSSIRKKAVVECTKVASEHFRFVRGAISSWGGKRLQLLKIKPQLFTRASRVGIVQVTVVRRLLCCWKTFYFSFEKPISALKIKDGGDSQVLNSGEADTWVVHKERRCHCVSPVSPPSGYSGAWLWYSCISRSRFGLATMATSFWPAATPSC